MRALAMKWRNGGCGSGSRFERRISRGFERHARDGAQTRQLRSGGAAIPHASWRSRAHADSRVRKIGSVSGASARTTIRRASGLVAAARIPAFQGNPSRIAVSQDSRVAVGSGEPLA